MSNPTAGLSHASTQMIEEIQKQAQEQIQKQQSTPQEVERFRELLAQQVDGTQQIGSGAPQQIDGSNMVAEALRNAQVNGAEASTSARPVEAATGAEGKGFRKVLQHIVTGQRKLDDIIRLASSGRKFGFQDLLAIQAGVYKYSQELELTSKVVEKATSGVKQTMQTQV